MLSIPDNVNFPRADVSKLTLEERMAQLEKRVDWQDFIHRNVGPDGNIYHKWNIIPLLAASVGIGILIVVLNQKLYT